MKDGKNEFKLRLNPKDVAEIAAAVNEGGWTPGLQAFAMRGAPFEDIQVAAVLTAFEDYMKLRHCEPGFELVLE